MRRFLIVLGTAAVLGVAITWLNQAGLCLGQMRFLTDQEKIDAAVQSVFRSEGYRRFDKHKRTRVPAWMSRFTAAADFRAAFPSCCHIGYDGPGDLLPVAIDDWGVTIVVINVPVLYDETDGVEARGIARTNIAVDACGRVRGNYDFFLVKGLVWERADG